VTACILKNPPALRYGGQATKPRFSGVLNKYKAGISGCQETEAIFINIFS